ncbi:dipeptidyl aminopeptidase A [[Candida] railenensis]|uniref:Dipeptidyl aminopeptidase A n=1 Tax=[Candida] railenensis TaxID=45579 RepID=A0A9P0VYJ7_9ASCO|nr:dipeptidyl aminopeptidase A [[Candida] railenensis]
MSDQEYELVDQSQNRARLEQEYRAPSYSQSSSHDSLSTRSSQDSTSSEVFDNIDSATNQRGDADDNFYWDDSFQLIWHNYGKDNGRKYFKFFSSKYSCYILLGISIVLWFLALFFYSKENHSKIMKLIKPDGANAKVVQTADRNITLSQYDPQFKNITLASFYNGEYLPSKIEVNWLDKRQYPTKSQNTIKNGGGYYLTRTSGSYIVKQMDSSLEKSGKIDIFINFNRFAYENDFFTIKDVILNPARPVDQLDNWHILVTDSSVQWRHSSFALFWVFNPLKHEFIPIQPPSLSTENSSTESELFKTKKLYKLHFAEFSPKGNYIVFGYDHDLFIYTLVSGEVKQITNTGSKDIFNGKADWLYEEDIISDDKLFWWSPDEAHLIYAKLNDTQVHDYDLNYYVKSADEIFNTYEEPTSSKKVHHLNQYPVKSTIKYSKPGTPNPRASIFHYKMSDSTTTEVIADDGGPRSEFIVYSGQWLGSDSFILKLSDRESRFLRKKVFNAKDEKMKDINEVDTYTAFGGWVSQPVPLIKVGEGYVDLMVEGNRSHLFYFESVISDHPSYALTQSSEWEVLDTEPLAYDELNNCIYFLSSKRSSMDVHLMSVDLTEHNIKEITGTSKDGKYVVNFSDDGQYLDLIYEGPSIPWQRLINMAVLHEHEHEKESTDCDSIIEEVPIFNSEKPLADKLTKSNLPTKVYRKILINPGNIFVDVVEILPPNFNPGKVGNKYPIFVNIYAGPGSQMTLKTFSIGFVEVVSATLNAIVLIIDPRGTGPNWASRSFSGHGQLGTWESKDIIAVTKQYIKVNEAFVNEDRVAIWGWSYGAYTTLKTLELDNGETFKYGMAVAPVTNWLFYDSVYAERYLWLPQEEGEDSYKRSQISDFANFKNIKRLLLVQGTSDDNVHIQNLYWLLDQFNLAQVENYDLQIFPDSDHSIAYHSASVIIYDKLMHWLNDAFSGKFDGLV